MAGTVYRAVYFGADLKSVFGAIFPYSGLRNFQRSIPLAMNNELG
jgi:hypothetical protein